MDREWYSIYAAGAAGLILWLGGAFAIWMGWL